MTIHAKSLKYKTAANRFLQSHPRLVFWAVLIVIILLGMTQATVARFGRSLDIDEPYTANMVHLPLSEFFEGLRGSSYSAPYHMLLKVWTLAFGESEFALRSLSLLFFGLTILTVGLTARRVVGLQGGLIAALLLAVSTNLGLVYAATARPYSLLCLQVSLAAYICFCLMRLAPASANRVTQVSTPIKDASLYLLLIALNVSGLLNHPIYIFFMCAYSLAAVFVSRRTFLLLVACSGVSVIIYLALWWPVLRHTTSLPLVNWMPTPSMADLGDAFLNLWGMKKTLLLLAYLVGITLFHLHLGVKALTSKLCLVSISIIGVASLLPFAVSQFRPVFIESRTPIILLPMACILAAALISQLGVRVLTVVVLTLLVVGSTSSSIRAFMAPDPYPVRTSVQYIVDTAECGDTLVLGRRSWSEVEYYLRRFDAPDCVRREAFPLDTQRHPGWLDVPGLLSQREELAVEAATTAARLADRSGSTVWLFYDSGYGHEITDILKSQLDGQLTFVQALDLSGSYFDSILAYSTDREGAVPSSMPVSDVAPAVVNGK